MIKLVTVQECCIKVSELWASVGGRLEGRGRGRGEQTKWLDESPEMVGKIVIACILAMELFEKPPSLRLKYVSKEEIVTWYRKQGNGADEKKRAVEVIQTHSRKIARYMRLIQRYSVNIGEVSELTQQKAKNILMVIFDLAAILIVIFSIETKNIFRMCGIWKKWILTDVSDNRKIFDVKYAKDISVLLQDTQQLNESIKGLLESKGEIKMAKTETAVVPKVETLNSSFMWTSSGELSADLAVYLDESLIEFGAVDKYELYIEEQVSSRLVVGRNFIVNFQNVVKPLGLSVLERPQGLLMFTFSLEADELDEDGEEIVYLSMSYLGEFNHEQYTLALTQIERLLSVHDVEPSDSRDYEALQQLTDFLCS